MKFLAGMLALAASAVLAQEIEPRGGGGGWAGGEHKPPTQTVYTTTTVCPVVNTVTEKGTTYQVTQLTTSTITVTAECKDCVTTVPGPIEYQGTTTEVVLTYTTACPVTETITGAGTTYMTTYTTTKTAVTVVPTTLYDTVYGPTVTNTAIDVDYDTVTSLYPVTETKTVEGATVLVTWTSTKLITKVVPVTQNVYTTAVTTKYATTEVYTTATHPVTTYTTIVAGSTVVLTETLTKTVLVTKSYTVTKVTPVTSTKKIQATKEVTVDSRKTVTVPSVVYVTIGGTSVLSKTLGGATVVAPVTSTIVNPGAAGTSGPLVVPTAAADAKHAPAVAMLAGIVGAFAML